MIGYFLRHLFVPHSSNNHRPKLLHHQSLAVLILLFVFLSTVVYSVRQTMPSVLGVATNITVGDLLQFTNQKRSENGVAVLTLNDQLTSAAQAKAADMFAKDYWAHNSPDGTTPWVFFQRAGYSYIFAGENLAKDFGDSSGVVNAWMASPSHKENLLSTRYSEVGFAVVNGKLNGSDTTLVVQEFGKRGEATAAVLPPSTTASSITPVPQQVAVIISLTPTPIPPTPKPLVTVTQIQPSLVAGVTNKPLINSAQITKNIAIITLSLFILTFLLDMVYIERKQLIRLVGHNIDHILYLIGAIGLILIFTKGIIL